MITYNKNISNYFSRFLIIFVILASLLLISCLSKTDSLENIIEASNNFDKYKDEYKNNEYSNSTFGLIINFDSDWEIKTAFPDFDNLEKKYAELVISKEGELLFIGSNPEKKMGIRLVAELRDISNEEYLKQLKEVTLEDTSSYKTEIITEEKITLKHIHGIHSVNSVFINKANIFIFDSLIFNYDKANFKIDIWCQDTIHQENKDYILNILNSTKFTGRAIILPQDNSTDIQDKTTDTQTM